MKKIILPFILVLCFAASGLAQEKAFQFGFKIGTNIGWVKPNTDGYKADGAKAGFNWGFVSDIHLVENYSIHTGFNINYINGAYLYPDKSGTATGVTNRIIHLKYFEIPVVLRMKTNEINKLTYFGEFGLGLGFRIGAKADDTFSENGLQINTSENVDVSDQYRITREAMILGVGAIYPIGGATSLSAGLRFNNNIFDVLKDQNKITSDEQKARFNFFELQIGLLF